MTKTAETKIDVHSEIGKSASVGKLDSPKPYCGEHSNGFKFTNGTNGHNIIETVRENLTYVPLHQRIEKRVKSGTPFFSLEFFPPKTGNGVANFITRLDRYRDGGPLFVDITWHLGSDPANLNKETSSSSIAAACLNYCRVDTMLHITGAQYSKRQTLGHLEQTKALGIRNILALRGDLHPSEDGPVVYQYRALDMIRWIREEYGDYFTVAASGYPLGHPEAPSYAADIRYLKDKVDAGAQFVITQLFFEPEVFEQFVRDCREAGITVPIIPGIMPIQSYESIRRIASLSGLTIPDAILKALEPIKENDEAVRSYGIHHAVEMCRRLLSNGSAPSIHLYTMNREGSCREILQTLGLWQQQNIRTLPWGSHCGQHPLRAKEDVRPIFWSSRPKSYVFRTKDWDEYPNGRWGNASSPAYNDLQDYYLFYLKGLPTKEELSKMYYNELKSVDDVKKVFVNFIKQEENENGVKVTRLPWSEQETGTRAETNLIKDQLLWCNKNGILTVNSQPSVNGAPSTDPLVGWGKPGGYCYQKAYLEFFVSRELAQNLRKTLEDYPQINYHMINHDCSIDWTNSDPTEPIAVTWGVFPGCEIAQPTVVDPLSFRVWKDEAYDAWLNNWANIYPDGSASRELIHKIHDEYVLVTLVDNDFVKPTVIFELLQKMLNS
uniref:methylenetetrahydrofolate reductase (NADPH) n=1 Tax=Acrobeloides nanus TaxID=290746 RepID=A0A914EJM8_9BILA